MLLEDVLALLSAEDPDVYQEATKYITDLDATAATLASDIIEKDTEINTLTSVVETLKAENAALKKLNAELFLKNPGEKDSESGQETTLDDISTMIYGKKGGKSIWKEIV